MGYSTCGVHGSHTCDCCDRCPKCSGFKKKYDRCPYGWCGTWHRCPDCHSKKPIDHSKCKGYHDAFVAGQFARKDAEEKGLPVIKAGVALPNRNVFAWTTQGNFEVSSAAYSYGLATFNHVLPLDDSKPRSDEYPEEVYGKEKRGAAQSN